MSDNNKFGDFEEIKDESQGTNQPQNHQGENVPTRVRMPRGKELIGRILIRLGGNRMDIKATDGKTRNCRVPGRYRRRLWLRPKDIVMITPDEFNDGKGEIIYKFRPTEVKILQKKGLLDNLKDEF
tara:strand:+ start:716 stop:1093 length:378 start_codon:yes stop_codon:yes gene_type:complete